VKKKKKKKLPTIKSLREKAWKLMSEYSRRKDADDEGFTACFTCGVTGQWTEFDAGHLWHASKQNWVTYDSRNIHAQCRRCNYFDSDAKVKGGLYVDHRYGPGTTDDLKNIKHDPIHMRRDDLESQIKALTEILEKMK
jgi:hypothetical protein